MISLTLFSVCGCTLGMKPSKTSVKVTNTMSNIDKANDEKDQTKNSMTISVQQDFKWGENE